LKPAREFVMRNPLGLLAVTILLTGCAVYPNGVIGPAPIAVAPIAVAPILLAPRVAYAPARYGWGHGRGFHRGGHRRW